VGGLGVVALLLSARAGGTYLLLLWHHGGLCFAHAWAVFVKAEMRE
jgi:hypothetical protein